MAGHRQWRQYLSNGVTDGDIERAHSLHSLRNGERGVFHATELLLLLLVLPLKDATTKSFGSDFRSAAFPFRLTDSTVISPGHLGGVDIHRGLPIVSVCLVLSFVKRVFLHSPRLALFENPARNVTTRTFQ